MLRVVALLLGLFALSCGPALSETYYVVPLDAVVAGTPDGTEGLPFLSIDKALKSGKVKGGDTLLLKDGAYGSVTIQANAAFDIPVTIMSQNGKAAHFDRILLTQDTRNLTLKNLSVWPRDPSSIGPHSLVRAYKTTSDITADGLDIRSEEDADDFMKWDAAKWEARKFNGIVLEGPRDIAIRNTLTGIYTGIFLGEDSQIIDNIVNGFNGDGINAVSRTTVRGNRILNCVKTDANHDDGFQSFASNGGSIIDLVLDSNVIIEWTGAADHPLRGALEGIGLFGGPYVNLKIVNNLVAVSHSHGISIYGAKGALVTNNTVVNIRGLSGTVPYIAIRPRNGTPSTDVLVVNNVAMSFQSNASTTDHVEFRDNSVIGIPSLVFENPAAFDYRPKASSGYIDTGDATVAPATDVAGHSRPSGPLPDRGAYEVSVHDAPVDPVAIDPVAVPIERPVKSPTITTITGDKTTTTTTISPGGSKWIMLDKRKVVETAPPGSIPPRSPLPFFRGKDRN